MAFMLWSSWIHSIAVKYKTIPRVFPVRILLYQQSCAFLCSYSELLPSKICWWKGGVCWAHSTYFRDFCPPAANPHAYFNNELTVYPTITSLHTANNFKFIFTAVIDKATRKKLCKLATEPPCKPSIRASHSVLRNDGPQGLVSKYQQHRTLLPDNQLYSRTWCCTPLSFKPLDHLLRKIIYLKA